jgi:DNA repair exonuclease SbcCD ATPase subunit
MNGESETIYVGGMEGFMIDAALKIVFTRISMQPRCGMFMIDEGISALDKKNMENLDQFFQFLEQFFPRVFIISHLREAQEFVQSSIHVRKDPLTQKSRLLC